MANLNELLNEYVEKFDEAFPLKFIGASEEEIVDIIQECIDTDTPYELEYDPTDDV